MQMPILEIWDTVRVALIKLKLMFDERADLWVGRPVLLAPGAKCETLHNGEPTSLPFQERVNSGIFQLFP